MPKKIITKKSIVKNLKFLWFKVISYISTNKLFLSYFVLSLISTTLVRHYTVGNALTLKPMLFDVSIILLIGAIGYLIRPKKQFNYFFIFLLIICLLCLVNTIYYVFYSSFASFGEIAVLSQAGEVTGSITEKFAPYQFIYLLFPVIFCWIDITLLKTNYFHFAEKMEKGRNLFFKTAIVGGALLLVAIGNATTTDYGRLVKTWNREYVVEAFGIVMYQGNDLVHSITPTLSSLFGYEEAANDFKEYYSTPKEEKKTKYTNKFSSYNVIYVHMESIQSFLMDLSFNGVEVTPNVNRLAKEGLFFSNFYPQISVGTSSDTEFTSLTSLMPAQTGAVFTSYYDREFDTLLKQLQNKDYYTFSMHANKASMWNRNVMHDKLGYKKFYSQSTYQIDEEIILGLSDKSFFRQTMPILEEIEKTNKNYMGTIITLSNHSPFDALDKYGEYDMTIPGKMINEETGLIEDTTYDYLQDTKMGNYIRSSHYADEALGEFISYINNSPYFDKTLFVFYGDHEARLSKKEFNNLYNFNRETGTYYEETDENYYEYDYYESELNKNTPLIIWNKNKKFNDTIDYPMGMIDLAPTIANMVGVKLKYALGNDIFAVKDNNVVAFPNGNFLTKDLYYYSAKNEYKVLKETTIDATYIEDCVTKVENILKLSNDIIVYDLIKQEGEKLNEETN